MPISHGHRPYEYNEFIPEMDANNLINAVKVKQNLYDQGTQALQAKLDQLSSLPLLRDVDKQYANQELSKIYKLVEENAHADFSNPNTTKSFLNMVKPLENDGVLQSAVLSTKEFMNRRNTLDEIRKKNPALISPANVDDYMEDALSWFDDEQPGSYLAPKTYSPYIDNSKKFMAIAKQITPEIRQQIIDTGEAWDTYTIERLTKERVSQAIMSQMSAAEMNQLRMDAKFNSKQVSTNDKYATLKNFYNTSIEHNNSIMSDSNASKEEKQNAYYALRADQDILTRMRKGDKDYIDGLYLNSYMANAIDGIGQAYAYTNIKQEREQNPYSMASFQGAIVRRNQANASSLKRQEELDKASYAGSVVLDENGNPKKNEDGTFVRDAEFWKMKRATYKNGVAGSEDSFRIYNRPTDAKKTEIAEYDRMDESLIDLQAGESKEEEVSKLDPQFVSLFESAIKYVTGEDDFSSDYNGDYTVRFESYMDPISQEKMTKVTLVDDDFVYLQNISFTLGEMMDYADAYNSGSYATPEQKSSAE